MNIRIEFPPNYAEVAAAFDLRGVKPIFAWGDTIYNPHDVPIPPELIAHESVHIQRQAGDPASWWQQYIADPQFRLNEELMAHAAEYRYIIDSKKSSRNQRRIALKITAQRLAAKLYGSLISVKDAKAAIAGMANAEWAVA